MLNLKVVSILFVFLYLIKMHRVMLKKIFYYAASISFMAFFFTSCEIEEPPTPDFSAHELSSSTNHFIDIAFNDLSSGNPVEWFWTFEGGTPAVSYKRNPVITYSEAGTYSVTLRVTNEDGSREIIKHDFINVGEFFNTTWTDIYITVGNKTKTILMDEYALFANINYPTIDYYAETSGLTATGEQIGLLIYWDHTVDLHESLAWDLIVDYLFVHLAITNDSYYQFTPFYVNWNTNYETEDNILIEDNTYLEPLGYYDAFDDMIIRTYFISDPDLPLEWIEGREFDLLWVDNQGVDLYYDGQKSNPEIKVKAKSNFRKNAKQIPQSGAKR